MKEVDIPTKWTETATMSLHLRVKILAVWSIDVLVLIPGTFQKIGEGTKSCLIPGISNTAHRPHEAYQFSLFGAETDLTVIIEYDPPQH